VALDKCFRLAECDRDDLKAHARLLMQYNLSLAIAHLRIRDEGAAGTLAVVSPFVADVVVEVGERLQRLPQRTLPLPRLLQLPLDPPQRRLSSQGLRPRRRPFAPRLLQLAT